MSDFKNMFSRDNVHLDLNFKGWKELFEFIGADLLKKGIVKESYTNAIIQREKEYPTGLPIKYGVAIPHTYPEHVIKPCIVITSFKNNINFKEMGNGERDISCKYAFFLVVNKGEEQVILLQKLISMFTNDFVMENLIKSTDVDKVLKIVLENV